MRHATSCLACFYLAAVCFQRIDDVDYNRFSHTYIDITRANSRVTLPTVRWSVATASMSLDRINNIRPVIQIGIERESSGESPLFGMLHNIAHLAYADEMHANEVDRMEPRSSHVPLHRGVLLLPNLLRWHVQIFRLIWLAAQGPQQEPICQSYSIKFE